MAKPAGSCSKHISKHCDQARGGREKRCKGLAKTGIGIREYARRRGVSHTAVGKAIRDGRITVEADGSIDPAKADKQWDAQTNPAMRRGAAAHASAATVASLTRAATKAVPAAALAAVDEALKDVDPVAPLAGGAPANGNPANPEAGTFLRARNANEVLRAQTAQLRLKKLAGDLVDRDKATGMVFELARRERDAWQNWPPRVAANMAAELGVDAHKMELALDKFIRIQLAELAEIKLDLR